MPNTNPATGIAFGYISANALDPEVVDRLQQGLSLEYQQALEEFTASSKVDPETGEPISDDDLQVLFDQFAEDWEDDEPTYEGTHEGVKYRTSWLGGALHVWIFESPHTTDKARRASPCVPGAAILDTLDGSETGYDVPPDWRADHGHS